MASNLPTSTSSDSCFNHQKAWLLIRDSFCFGDKIRPWCGEDSPRFFSVSFGKPWVDRSKKTFSHRRQRPFFDLVGEKMGIPNSSIRDPAWSTQVKLSPSGPSKKVTFFKPPFLKVTKTEETGPKILSFVEASDFRPYVLKPSPDGGFGVLPILLGMAFWGHKNHVMKCQELNSWMKDQRNISKQVFVWWNLAVKSLDLCLVKLLALLDHVHPGNQKFQDITGNQTPFPNQPSGCFQK